MMKKVAAVGFAMLLTMQTLMGPSQVQAAITCDSGYYKQNDGTQDYCTICDAGF
jgi:hypothetical protein